MVEVHSCSNMVKTLTQAVADGWQVLGAAADSKAQDCRSLSVNQPTILVVGECCCGAFGPQYHGESGRQVEGNRLRS